MVSEPTDPCCLEEGLQLHAAPHQALTPGPTLNTPLLPEPHAQPSHPRTTSTSTSTCSRRCLAAAASATVAALLLLHLLLHPNAPNPSAYTAAATLPASAAASSTRYQCPQGLGSNPNLTFFIIGDWGRQGNPNQISTQHIMRDIATCLPPDFIISTGDNFYPSGLSHPSDPFISESFSSVYESQALQVPWYSVLGNHDYGDSFKGSWKRCPKPKALSDCGPCCISPLWQVPAVNPQLPKLWRLQQGAWMQSFLGGQLDVVFIDTTPFIHSYYKKSWADVTGGIVYQDTRAQEAEIEALLHRSSAPWKLVVGHHPVYSFGEHCNGAPKLEEEEEEGEGGAGGAGASGTAGGDTHKNQCSDMRWLQLLMNKHGVTAYLSGHDHDLQYIRHLDDPLHYIVSGAGSDIRPDEFDGADTSSLSQHYFTDDQGFVTATLQGATMSMHFYAAASDQASYSVTFPARS